MLDNDKRWKDRFEANLDDESWLDSSESTYTDLESMIFDEEKEDKVVWFPKWVIGLIGVLIIGTVIRLVIVIPDAGHSISKAKVPSTEINQELVSDAIAENQNSIVEDKTTEISHSASESQSNSLIEIEDSSNSKVLIESSNSLGSPDNISSNRKVKTSDSPVITNTNSNATYSNPLGFSRSSTTSIIGSKDKSIAVPVTSKMPQLEAFNLVDILRSRIVFESNRVLPLGATYFPLELDLTPRALKNEISFGAGYSIVDYKLNQNFRSAVDPADFTHSLGKGYYLSAGYRHYFNDIFSVSFGADIVSNQLLSGHNSNQSVTGEQSQEELEILMATPLGFMTGEVSVAYTGTGQESREFVMDLENSHRYYNLDLQSTLGIQLYNSSLINAGIDLGIGLQRIFNLENNMESYILNDDQLTAEENAIITQDQGTLNRSMIFTTVGARVDYILSARSSLGLNYRINSGLQQIHAQNGLGTDILKHKVGLSYQLRF